MNSIMIRKGMMVLAVSAVALSLAACGVKSSPAFPEGGEYPRRYPAPGPQTQTSAPAPSKEQVKETEDGARSPLGFPLEYPNRPSYN